MFADMTRRGMQASPEQIKLEFDDNPTATKPATNSTATSLPPAKPATNSTATSLPAAIKLTSENPFIMLQQTISRFYINITKIKCIPEGTNIPVLMSKMSNIETTIVNYIDAINKKNLDQIKTMDKNIHVVADEYISIMDQVSNYSINVLKCIETKKPTSPEETKLKEEIVKDLQVLRQVLKTSFIAYKKFYGKAVENQQKLDKALEKATNKATSCTIC